jgi:hypothetical protein
MAEIRRTIHNRHTRYQVPIATYVHFRAVGISNTFDRTVILQHCVKSRGTPID